MSSSLKNDAQYRYAALMIRLTTLMCAVDQQCSDDWPLAALGFFAEAKRTMDKLQGLLMADAENWCQRTAFCARCGHPRYAFRNHEPLCVACYDNSTSNQAQENVQ